MRSRSPRCDVERVRSSAARALDLPTRFAARATICACSTTCVCVIARERAADSRRAAPVRPRRAAAARRTALPDAAQLELALVQPLGAATRGALGLEQALLRGSRAGPPASRRSPRRHARDARAPARETRRRAGRGARPAGRAHARAAGARASVGAVFGDHARQRYVSARTARSASALVAQPPGHARLQRPQLDEARRGGLREQPAGLREATPAPRRRRRSATRA